MAGTALAFVGSTLVGSVVGLPSALADSGLTGESRGLASLDSSQVLAGPVVAGSADYAPAAFVGDQAPVQVVSPLPTFTFGTASGSVGGAPGAVSSVGAAAAPAPAASLSAAAMGIPAPMLDAYRRAAQTKNQLSPSCEIDWSLIAAIGKVESDHAQGGKVDENGNTRGQIEGPMTRYGTAKGPMQFLDSSWQLFGADGNGDGVKDVNNAYDAALGAANHLCSSGKGSMKNPISLHDAIFGYNRAEWYVQKVVALANAYSGGGYPVPASTGTVISAPTTTTTTTTTGGSTGSTGSGSTSTPSTGTPSTGTPAPTGTPDTGSAPTGTPKLDRDSASVAPTTAPAATEGESAAQ
ncbi:MAG: lytic transglycosylase domain-containing protein [Actinomycetales bacterium]